MKGEARKQRRAEARKERQDEEAARGPSKLVSLLLGVCAIAGFFLVHAAWVAITDRYWSGSLSRATLTSAGILGTVYVSHTLEDGSYADWRVVVVDPLTGARTARRVLGDDQPECEEVEAGLLWCRIGDEFRALDLPSLGDRVTWGELRKAVPALALGIEHGPIKVDGDALVVTANDGRAWALHAAPPRGVLAAALPGHHADELRIPDPFVGSLPVGTGTLELLDVPGGTRRAVALRLSGGSPGAPVRASGCSETYLKPRFVRLRVSARSVTDPSLHDPDGGLVWHESSLEHGASHSLVSRVGLDGCPVWTHDLGRGQLSFVTRAGGILAVVGDFPADHAAAVGLDLASGVERWRRSF
jgi:hypothetical protein